MKITFNTISYGRQFSRPSFKGFECDERDFELKNLYNIHCPICNVDMIKKVQMESFIDSIQDKTGSELALLLKKYHKYYHEKEASIADILAKSALENSNENIAQLTSRFANEGLNSIRQTQLETLENVKNSLTGLSKEKRQLVKKIINNAIQTLKSDEIILVDTKELLNELSAIVPQKLQTKDSFLNLIKNTPYIKKNVVDFFKEFQDKSQSNIAYHLLASSNITCEHIKPKVHGGENNTANYLLECVECNSNRNDRPFAEFANNKSFENNLRNYMSTIARKLENGELSSKYIDYLDDISKTIKKETNGLVDIKPPLIKVKDFVGQELLIDSILSDLEEKKGELEKLNKRIAQAQREEQYPLVCEYLSLIKNHSKISDELEQIRMLIFKTKLKIKNLAGKYGKIVATQGTNSEESQDVKSKLEQKITESDELYKKVGQLQEEKNLLDEKIENLKTKIIFPSKILEQINILKARKEEYNANVNLIASLKAKVAQRPQLQSQASNIKQHIEELKTKIKDNVGYDEKNITKYRNLEKLMSRVDELKQKTRKNSSKKTSQLDIEIYQFASQKMQDEMNALIQYNESVYQTMTMDKIQKLTEKLDLLNARLKKINTYEKRIKELELTLEHSATPDELNREIQIFTIQKTKIEDIFNIDCVKKEAGELSNEVTVKSEALSKFSKGEITKDKLLEIMSWY